MAEVGIRSYVKIMAGYDMNRYSVEAVSNISLPRSCVKNAGDGCNGIVGWRYQLSSQIIGMET
jgi:hypothetical protein